MSGFAKLMGSILTSSIWDKDASLRLTWITLLAMADKDGVVEASATGIAHMARVSLEDVERALLDFQGPDPQSRSSDFEGRRLQRVEGGWLVLNYTHYRNLYRSAERRGYLNEYQRKRRQHLNTDVNTVNHVNQSQPIADADADADAEVKAKSRPLASGSLELGWRVVQAWKAHLDQRRIFYQTFDGRVPPDPTLTEEIRKAILAGLKTHDTHYLTEDLREDWTNLSKVRAAGMGIFHDSWCSGRDKDSTKRFLEPWRPWKTQRGKGDPIERFAQTFFDQSSRLTNG